MDDLLVEPLVTSDHRADREGLGAPAGTGREVLSTARVGEERRDRARERFPVARRDEDARLSEHLGQTINGRGDAGLPGRHGLDEGEAETLPARGHAEDVESREEPGHVRAVAVERDRTADPEALDEALEVAAPVAFARDHELRVGVLLEDEGEGAEELVEPLLPVQAPDRPDELPGSGQVRRGRRLLEGLEIDAVRNHEHVARPALLAREPGGRFRDRDGPVVERSREAIEQHARSELAALDDVMGRNDARPPHERSDEARDEVRVEQVGVEDLWVEVPEEPHEEGDTREVDLRSDAQHVNRNVSLAELAREGAVLAAEAPEGQDVRFEASPVEARRELVDDSLGSRGTELGDHEDHADHLGSPVAPPPREGGGGWGGGAGRAEDVPP